MEREASELMADVAKVVIERYGFMSDMGGPRPFDALVEVLQREIIKQMKWEPSKYAAERMDLHPWSVLRQRPRSSTPRQRLSHGKVMRVFARDGFQCIICGSRNDLTVDHIYPLYRGGTNDEANLATMCSTDNGAKSDAPLEVYLKTLPLHRKRHYYKTHAALIPRPVAGAVVVWGTTTKERK